MRRIALVLVVVTITVWMLGCASTHFTVYSAPASPENMGSYKMESATIPVTLQISNFVIGKVDTLYPENEKEIFRKFMALQIPNMLQEDVGKRQVFSSVTRVADSNPATADYIMSGHYDFFERLGTQGREWIPYAGTFGAQINEATIKGDLEICITKAATGNEVLRKTFTEDHSDRTSVYQKASAGYLQADYIAAIASEIIGAVEKAESVNVRDE